MIKRRSKQSLADKIAGLLNVVPANIDPEEDTNTDTLARVADYSELTDEDELSDSKFRKQNINLLEDIDLKYSGTKGSRTDLKKLNDDFDEESAEDDEESNEDDESNEGSQDWQSFEENSSISEGDSSHNESNLSEEDEPKDVDSNFKHIKDTNITAQMKKGACIKNQLNIWENLLEMRIQLQKCLVTSNKMPQYNLFKGMKQSNEFSNAASETKKCVSEALFKMLELQKTLIKKYPETKKLLNSQNKEEKKESSDEEILSDTESEASLQEDECASPRKKIKYADYEKEIVQIYNSYQPYRNSTIQKWNEKTRVVIGKNPSDHSVLNQISHNLNDRKKLIKRTQLKRSNYKILGMKEEESTNTHESNSRAVDEYNSEIFDDDDFYHHLLRELIEVKSADLTDPVQLGRQWIQLQNLRSKMKRKIDTRATKGRKIRYAIHSKLINFMAPIDENSWTDEAKTELFNSLFGKLK